MESAAKSIKDLNKVYQEAVYGQTAGQELAKREKDDDAAGAPNKDKRHVVTYADKRGNTPAYQKYKAGDKNYKAADHLKDEYEPLATSLEESGKFTVEEIQAILEKDSYKTVAAVIDYDRSKKGSKDATYDSDHGEKKKAKQERDYAAWERSKMKKDDPNWKHKKYHTGMHGEEVQFEERKEVKAPIQEPKEKLKKPSRSDRVAYHPPGPNSARRSYKLEQVERLGKSEVSAEEWKPDPVEKRKKKAADLYRREKIAQGTSAKYKTDKTEDPDKLYKRRMAVDSKTKMKEEVVDEAKVDTGKSADEKATARNQRNNPQKGDKGFGKFATSVFITRKLGEPLATGKDSAASRKRREAHAAKRGVKEEVIDELHKKTLGSYVKKASQDLSDRRFDQGDSEKRKYDPDERDDKEENKLVQREKGIKRAADKLTKEGYQRNPEKGEEEERKAEKRRKESGRMPPRGDKRREDFEKWYAANVK